MSSTAVTAKTLPEWKRLRPARLLYRALGLLLAVGFVGWSLDVLRIDVDRLPGLFGRIADVLSRRYWPPDLAHVMKPDFISAIIDTFQMSYVATVVGLMLAVPLSWFASVNMTPSKRWLYPVCRLVVMACRSVHEMIWTIVLVAVVGFGMLPGTLAMTLFCIGFGGKLMAEAIEAIRKGPVEAIRATGAGHLQTFVFAVLPQVRVAWAGIAIYTWDVVFRASTVVGFFGAGGMGHFLRESVQKVESRQVSAIILTIVVIVIVAELLSAWARARIARAVA
ncbi:MAG: phosphonate ABC transporter, permease protein PhnE [Ideonella sp.]|jgi:phosphonate transport system permease protein|nr:phosphonate ABC transporter, permease protein PhnE [Ideonella sp.]MBL0151767.1 phosphonate ABC transporter, permease protein PhnE [Ideonella sp.]